MNNDRLENIRALPLTEDFYTLQGEGAHSGTAAWFIRLAGCDVCCPWCDSRESRDAAKYPSVAVDEIVRRAAAHIARTVVITGGEPLMHPLDELTEALCGAGKTIHLETSGTHPFSGSFDWVCLSPKRRRPPLDEAWARADELKVVIETPDDLAWAEECAAQTVKTVKTDKNTVLFLQPEWSRADTIIPVIIDHIKANPRWRISLQTHKYIGLA